MGGVFKKNVTVVNKWGLHAKAAFALAKEAMKFDAEITVEKNGNLADGKRIDELLMLCAGRGDTLSITTEGPDGETAMNTLADLAGSKFGEE